MDTTDDPDDTIAQAILVAHLLEELTLDRLVDEVGFHTQRNNTVWMETYGDDGDIDAQYRLTITAKLIMREPKGVSE